MIIQPNCYKWRLTVQNCHLNSYKINNVIQNQNWCFTANHTEVLSAKFQTYTHVALIFKLYNDLFNYRAFVDIQLQRLYP